MQQLETELAEERARNKVNCCMYLIFCNFSLHWQVDHSALERENKAEYEKR